MAEPSAAPPNPALETRVAAIAAELRCLVCQNQTIADSNAELAVDLRRIIREQLSAGRSEREVLDFMAARYGDFVLYRPPLKPTTALLWGGPALMVALGGAALWFTLRRRQRLPASAFDAEDPEDHDQADRQPR
jgi:cytochrome c-type biogenesis protein CcmH